MIAEIKNAHGRKDPSGIDWRSVTVHPVADLFPMLAPDELQSLADDIKANGLRDAIVLDAEGKVLLDGRNRRKACEMVGITPTVTRRPAGEDPVAYIFSTNLNRRDMSKGQKAMVIAKTRLLETSNSQAALARVAGLSQQRISQACMVLKFAPDMADGVAAGSTGLDEAVEEARRRKSAASGKDVQMDRLRAEAQDLADLVKQGKMRLSEAIAALDQRITDHRNAKRSATRALVAVLTALETGESSPLDAAKQWIDKIDFSLDPYPLPLTRRRLEASKVLVTEVLNHLIGEAK
jgi:ParB-like chromosome segregation protein Spo0J